uniref:AP-3 complex subunit mu n=1 Tax=Nannochloropsis gaditana (strain CCMP526) TaxID=1093141 RepID=I2CP32_NANGC
MIHSLFILNQHGEVLIEKHWRSVTPRAVCDFFWDEVNKYPEKEDVPPLIAASKYNLINIYREDLFLVASMLSEIPPLLVIEFLHRILDIFSEYFGGLEDSSIKDNFSTVYQLLEEMMDHGYPLTTEPNALKAMIRPPTLLTRLEAAATGKASGVSNLLPDGTVSNMPWRKSGVKYNQNEIYLDIVEEMDAIVDCSGQVVSAEVSGFIFANSRLSGIPDLSLLFVDPDVIDDCSFHPCVRYNRFERDRTVSFVPPDGHFELMRYRVTPRQTLVPPIYCTAQIVYSSAGKDDGVSSGRLTLTLGCKPVHSLILNNKGKSLSFEDVKVTIPFPKAVRTTHLQTNTGTVLYDEASKVARWTVGKMSRERNPQLTGTILLAGGRPEESPSIQVDWKVPMASVSGLTVLSLQLLNERYRPYKGVRTITKSGRFQVRSS